MSSAPLQELVDGKATVVPLTVEQYHRMIETGILDEGEPIELLDGFLVRKDRSAIGEDPMTIGHHHAWVLEQLQELLADAGMPGARLRIQQPVTLLPDCEPEPDAVVAAGDSHTFRTRHPGAEDILCVLEVSDSSLDRDRTTKQRIYAEHGIQQYILINLVESMVEEYRDPSTGTGCYAHKTLLRRGDHVHVRVSPDGSVALPVDALLP